jgi:hypothetical protein
LQKLRRPSSGLIARVRRFFARGRVASSRAGRGCAAAVRVIASLLLTIQGFSHAQVSGGAAALTYVTVLSQVPFLAFAFSIAKGFGAY